MRMKANTEMRNERSEVFVERLVMTQSAFMEMMYKKEISLFPQTEEEVREKYGITVPCCGSCHDDLDEGYGPMSHIYWPDDTETEVCCAVKIEYDEKNNTEMSNEANGVGG
jgi:hypothetical protein